MTSLCEAECYISQHCGHQISAKEIKNGNKTSSSFLLERNIVRKFYRILVENSHRTMHRFITAQRPNLDKNCRKLFEPMFSHAALLWERECCWHFYGQFLIRLLTSVGKNQDVSGMFCIYLNVLDLFQGPDILR